MSSGEEMVAVRIRVLTRSGAHRGPPRVGRTTWRSPYRLLALLLTASMAACGAEGIEAVEAVDDGSVPAALRFRGPTLSDGTLDLTELAGEPVALWFWSSSCTDCAKMAPTAEVLHQVYRESAAVVGVTCSSPAAARAFEQDHELSFPTLLDTDGTFTTALGIACQPSWAFVATDGSVEVQARAMDFDELTGFVDAARTG